MMKSIGIVATLLLVVFAGCSDSGPSTTTSTDKVGDDFKLQAGKGGIAGLLLDDRFRPVDLEDEGAGGQFQAIGFILLQETGERKLTTSDGEFSFENLEPGTYKIRVNSDRHEFTPQSVVVVAGEFTEIQLEGRRVATDNSFILSTEGGVFIPCAISAPIISTTLDCLNDQSGDSFRSGVLQDYTSYNDTVQVIVTETYMDREASAARGAFKTVFRERGDGQYYSSGITVDSKYIYMLNRYDEVNTEQDADGSRNVAFINDRAIEAMVFPQGGLKEETQVIMDVGFGGGDNRGLGAQIGVRGKVLQSVFMDDAYESNIGFCALCPGGSLN